MDDTSGDPDLGDTGQRDLNDLFTTAASAAAGFRASLDDRPTAPQVDIDALTEDLAGPLPEGPQSPHEVLAHLRKGAEPGITSTAGPRFFGFVIGGALPAASAADILAVGWDQTAFNAVLSPAGAVVERAAGGWLKDLLGLPSSASCGFVTGAQAANTVGLATGRQQVLADVGWDVARNGLQGAPRVRVVASVERHATIDRSVRLLGLGDETIESVRADDNGAIDVAALGEVLASQPPGPTLVCLQSGNVNTGACDDLRAAIPVAHEHGAWAHVDGAFGLWAAASPRMRHLTDGLEAADSWACDGHKWLNVPYDSAFAFTARADTHAAAISYSAAYLTGTGVGQPELGDLALESSRRARGFAVWAALQQLGRRGVADLVDRCCALARRFADQLSDAGFEIVNDVVLNQVLVDAGGADTTTALIAAIQRDGTCWMGGTVWRGRTLMRISVSNWSTTESDVDRSVAAIVRLAAELGRS